MQIIVFFVTIPVPFPSSGMFIHRPSTRALVARWIIAVARDKAAQCEADDSLGVTPHPAHVSILA
jgi:hypothetical protein